MSARFFGQYLLEKGVITAESLLKAVQLQDRLNLKLGAYAIKVGALSERQATELNSAQRTEDFLFGELAVQRGHLTRAKLEELLALQAKEHLFIGEALVRVGALTRDALDHELPMFASEQKAWAQGSKVLPPNVPHGRELALLVDLTVKMLRRCTDLLVRASQVSLEQKSFAPASLETVVAFKGALAGWYGLRMSRTLAQSIGKGMTAESAHSDSALADAVKEFSNIVAGNVCATLRSMGLVAEISPPKHSAPAAARDVSPAMQAARSTLETLHGPIVLFFESPL